MQLPEPGLSQELIESLAELVGAEAVRTDDESRAPASVRSERLHECRWILDRVSERVVVAGRGDEKRAAADRIRNRLTFGGRRRRAQWHR